jgi:hypothetical protein
MAIEAPLFSAEVTNPKVYEKALALFMAAFSKVARRDQATTTDLDGDLKKVKRARAGFNAFTPDVPVN